ncbi:MFS transporter [Streptomyces sp. NPDC058457]|uniref:MFS transporter n=1 Tax=Streptomyces sp. NPDC058457 TaxID=3346507 RepID=UPI003662A018
MSATEESTVTPVKADVSRFTPRQALTLVALLWTTALTAITGLLAGNAQADIAIHFHTTQIAWFTQGPQLISVFLTPFIMKFATVHGKKRMIVIITIAGLIGDVIAASATNYDMLLVGRVLAGAYVPTAALCFSMVRDVFPPRVVGTASGVLAASAGLVGLGGPFLSAWLIDDHGFRAALWFIAASTAGCLALLLLCVPESPVREPGHRIDYVGGLLLGGGLTVAVYTIGEGSQWGWTSGKALGGFAIGLVALIIFFFYEARVAQPLIPLAMIKRDRLWSVVLATSITAGSVYAVGTAIQLLALMPTIPHVSDGLGWSVTKNAVVGAPLSASVIIFAILTGKLAKKFDTRILLAIGGVLAVSAYVFASQVHDSVGAFLVLGLLSGPGMGLIVAAMPIMIIQFVTPEEQALANGSQWLVQGVMQVVITQLVFSVMTQHGTVAQGTQFYSNASYSSAFWLVAGTCLGGTLLVAAIPKARRIDTVEAGQAA